MKKGAERVNKNLLVLAKEEQVEKEKVSSSNQQKSLPKNPKKFDRFASVDTHLPPFNMQDSNSRQNIYDQDYSQGLLGGNAVNSYTYVQIKLRIIWD